MGDYADVSSVRKSIRLGSATPKKGNVVLQEKPKSILGKSAQKLGLVKNPKDGDAANDIPKSAYVRRKLDLHNLSDEDKNIDETEKMDENQFEVCLVQFHYFDLESIAIS